MNIEFTESIQTLLADKEEAAVFVDWINKLAQRKSAIIVSQEGLKEDVKSMSESYNIPTTYLNKMVDSLAKDTLNDEKEKLESLTSLLEIIS